MIVMKSKWGFIVEVLKDVGKNWKHKEQLIELAEKIDSILKDLYGTQQPEDWVDDYMRYRAYFDTFVGIDLSLNGSSKLALLGMLLKIAGDVRYCIACQTDIVCEDCQFSEVAGLCNDDGSLFDKFWRLLKEELKYTVKNMGVCK